MPPYAAFYQGLYCFLRFIETISRDRNTYFYRFSGITVLLIMVGVFAMKVLEETHWPNSQRIPI